MANQHAEHLSHTDEVITVGTRKPAGAVLSVRVPRDLVIAVDEFATERDLSMSDVVRAAIEYYVSASQSVPAFPTLYASINTYANVVLTSPEAQVHSPTRGEAQTETMPGQSTLAVAG